MMFAYAAYRLSQRIHAKMVFALLHSRVEQFLSRVSSGRIINRFSNDLNHVDSNCFTDTDYVIYMTASVATTLLMYCQTIGYRSLVFILAMVPLLLYLQRTYMSVKREAIRLEAVAKSPMLTILSDSLKGLAHIRSSGLQSYFKTRLFDAIQECIVNSILLEGSNGWYNLRCLFTSLATI